MKEYKISGVVNAPEELTEKDVLDIILDALGSNNCYFGGSFRALTEQELKEAEDFVDKVMKEDKTDK